MDSSLPVVAIIGSANAGKSTLFNSIVGAPQAIVAREAGTTRDAIHAQITHGKHNFWLIDTAGLKKADDDFEATIQEQIHEISSLANLIIVVKDSSAPLSSEDKTAAKLALKSKKHVVLAVNKIDKGLDDAQFKQLGIREVYRVQANQGRGVEGLLAHIVDNIPQVSTRDEHIIRVGLIGRTNMGKSHLLNAIGKKQQALVADEISTTRDINRIRTKSHGQIYEFWDTAGIRKPGKVSRGVEAFSMARTMFAIDNVDICLFVIDASEPSTALDKKIAGLLKDSLKPIIMVVNKWDLIEKDDKTQSRFAARLSHEFPFVWWVPLIFTSAKTGHNVAKLYEVIDEVLARSQTTIKTRELNKLLKQITAKHPPAGLKNRHPKLRYITQTSTTPQVFDVFGSQLDFLHWSYKRHIENVLREEIDLSGVPIKIHLRDRDDEKK